MDFFIIWTPGGHQNLLTLHCRSIDLGREIWHSTKPRANTPARYCSLRQAEGGFHDADSAKAAVAFCRFFHSLSQVLTLQRAARKVKSIESLASLVWTLTLRLPTCNKSHIQQL